MGTKANPGAYDCHANADDDEPMFTLLARDPAAPQLVERWADYARANGEVEKADEALACASEMRSWRAEHR